jgi:uncharacterized phage protein gp47/JayE
VSGLVVQTADGVRFHVVADPSNGAFDPLRSGYVIPAQQAALSAPVVAETAGASGNVGTGAVTLISGSAAYVDAVSNPAPFSGGADAEADEAFRARFVHWIATLGKATPEAVRHAAASVSRDGDALVFEGEVPGSFRVIADDGSGAPPASYLAQVRDAVEATRPLGVQYSVSGPRLVLVDVAFQLTPPVGLDGAPLRSAAVQAATRVLNEMRVGEVLRFSKVLAVLWDAAPQADNIASLTLNAALGDIDPGVAGVIRAGAVTAR